MNIAKEEVTGVILAGGLGRRMNGQDKGLLQIAGRSLTQHIIERLRPQVGQLMINANRSLDFYQSFNLPMVTDGDSDFRGPLAGLLATMASAQSEWVITVPVDSPLLSMNYVSRMCQANDGAHESVSVAFGAGRLQPVFALVHRSLQKDLRHYLAADGRRIDRWFRRYCLLEVDFNDCPDMFHNINDPGELDVMQRYITG